VSEAARPISKARGAEVHQYAYDAAGQLTRLTRPNGTSTDYGYDVRGRAASLADRGPGGAALWQVQYGTDASGRRTSAQESGPGWFRTLSYQYDPLGRLVQETLTDGAPSGQRVSTWSYDAVGNRLVEDVRRGTSVARVDSTYDDNDRLLGETGTGPAVTYSYDAAGQLLARTDGAGTSTFSYDAAHRLVAATTPTTSVAYSYDPDGLRQSQTVDGVTTRFVTDPTFEHAQVIAEVAADGSETHYTYGLTRLARHRGGASAYLHSDALGSLRAATSSAGTLAERWNYHAFGTVDSHVDAAGQAVPLTGADAHSFLFAGEQYSPSLNLYYLRARHYAPAIGRFTQADTYRGRDREPLTLHRYGYAHGNPITGRDPSGMSTLMEADMTLMMGAAAVAVAMPAMVQIGQTLRFDTVVNALLALRNAATGSVTAEILRRCIAAGAAGVGPCRSRVNTFVLGADAGAHTQHVADAIAAGRPQSLRRKPPPAHNRKWLNAFRGPGMPCENTTKESGRDCDEYPFAATEEGGQYGNVSIRGMSASDNRLGGAYLQSRFYDPCDVPAGPSADPFLVIASAQIPVSGGICKR
jgi:RHS repeat-associated protein